MAPHMTLDFSQLPNGNANENHIEAPLPSPEAFLDSFLDSFTNGAQTSETSVPLRQSTTPQHNVPSNGIPSTRHQNGNSMPSAGDEGPEPIAIVGLAFQFPGGIVAEDDFWDMMIKKECLSTDFPADRINIDAFYSPDDKKKNTIHTKKAHFLKDDIYKFDASFFSISPPEASAMDPCQRGLLETTYHALENAGITLPAISGTNTSVHVGCFTNDYMTFAFRDIQRIPKYAASGVAQAALSNRLSWFYNLRGASVTLDTACSSGVVALDLACQGLWNGRTDAAIVAGANLILSPEMNISLSSLNFLSKDGKCFSFDHRANGYARGEGFAVLVLKPLSKALAAGHKIRALIRSVGSNQDGRTTGGMMFPSREMQAQLIRETYARANLDMSQTAHFESHGTGTNVGDPTEARALGEAFSLHRSPDNPLYIGALKANIGHLEGASGLASVIKVVLALERGVIPPNTNFEKLNPKIDAKRWNLKFPQVPTQWPRTGLRRASVNSFGFGGANAHVVLDDAFSGLRERGLEGRHSMIPPGAIEEVAELVEDEIESSRPHLLVFYASDEAGIERQVQAHSQYLKQQLPNSPPNFLSNYAYTLSAYRTKLNWTSFAVIEAPLDIQNLPSIISRPSTGLGSNPRLGLVFTGQGAQWPGMGRELLAEPTFKESIQRSEKHLADLGCEWSLFDLLADQSKAASFDEAQYSQVLTTAIQVSLVDLLFWLGITPSVVVGHSSGEIAAAYAAGHISSAAAMKISYYRGLLGSKLEQSSGERYGMVAVGLSREETEVELEQISGNELAVSCINSPSNVTISGPEHQLDGLVSRLQERGIFSRKLKVKLGYHSSQMSRISGEYFSLLGDLEPGSPREVSPVIVSSVTANIIGSELSRSGKYWIRNMVSAVDFLGAMEVANTTADRPNGWLEIGPHSALQGPLRQILQSVSLDTDVVYTSALIRHKSAVSSLLSAAGQLHCNNFAIDVSLATDLGLSTEQRNTRTMLSNLPSYQFNHATRYLSQSQSATNFRLRTNGNHDLLGTLLGDPNAYEAQWKFIIREDDMPWVRDHKVNGVVLYPAAGMLIMAIEAAKQLLGSNGNKPPAFELQNVEFPAPINLTGHENEGTEVRIHMSSDDEKEVFGFRIFLCQKDNAHEIVCRGTIRGSYPFTRSGLQNGREDIAKVNTERAEYKSALESCTNSLSQEQMYQVFLSSTRFEYGPEFQPLAEVQFDGIGHAIATMAPYDAGKLASSHTVHPTRLDCLFQLCLSALHGIGRATTLVPTRIGKMWLPVEGFGHASSTHVAEKAFVKVTNTLARTSLFDVKTFDGENLDLKAWIEALELTSVAANGGDERDAQAEIPEYLCSNIEWAVDIDGMTDVDLHRHCEQMRLPKEEEPVEWFRSLDDLMVQFGARAIHDVEKLGGSIVPSLERYIDWLRHHTQGASSISVQDADELNKLCEPFLQSKLAETYITVAQNLSGILVGTVDPLDLLFGGDSKIADFYIALSEMGSGFSSLHRYLTTLTHKFPDLKFLEVGGGTAGVTSFVINSIGNQEQGPAFEHYTFTDISPFFFDKARKRFLQHEKRMTYTTLDIEKDPVAQEFELGAYDIIIADNVLHATKDLSKTLANVRKLLKPGGKLVLRELIAPEQVLTGFMFGLLPGWWLAEEEFRKMSPVIDEDRWNGVLKAAGFSGTDLVFRDHLDERAHLWSIMVATAVDIEGSSDSDIVVVPDVSSPTFILDPESTLQATFASSIGQEIGLSSTLNTALLAAAATQSSQNANMLDFVLLYEIEKPLIAEIDAASLESLRTLLQSARSILWIKSDITSGPSYGISDGLCRVARHENPNIYIATLSISSPATSSPTTLAHITHVFQTMQSAIRCRSRNFEAEYTSSGFSLAIPRLRRAKALDSHIHTLTKRPVLLQALGRQKLKLGTQAPGLLDKICFMRDTSTDLKPLGLDEIEVKVGAFGVNFKDCLTLLGRVKTDMLGLESAGIVARTGSAVTDLRIGDRIAVGALDSFRTYLRVPRGNVARIPSGMSITEAAAVPIAYSTVYYSLVEVARLKAGETVLIHAAAGGTGQAAVQIAQWIGAEVFCTVGSENKKQLLIDTYAIPEDHILYSRDTSFADGIKRLTKNGVDVILNSTSGRLMEASWDCIAPFGRFIEIGLKDAFAGNSLPMSVFTRNATFAAVDMSAILARTDGSTQRLMTKVFELFEQGKLRTASPLGVYGIGEIEQAFRLLQSGKSAGKIVLEVDEKAALPIVQGPYADFHFEANATYVIAGGLGGLGRSIARWLVCRGARNLVLLSRSGSNSKPEAQDLLSEMAKSGVNVQCPRCDIANLSALQIVIDECSATMPPIRGCFQASMVLRDAALSHMTHDTWSGTTNPKITGSWNLHLSLPSDMSFFILLSSVVGVVANDGQASYAAGNTYLDGLAHHLTSTGARKKVVSLDIGYVLGEGYVAENERLMEHLQRLDFLRPLTLEQIFTMLDYYCNPDVVLRPEESQVIIGLELPANTIAKGGRVAPRLNRPIFKHLHAADASVAFGATGASSQTTTHASAFISAESAVEGAIVTADALKEKLARVLGMPVEHINVENSISSYGVDSLVGLELRSWLAKEMGTDVAVFELVGSASLKDIGMTVAERSSMRPKAWDE